LLVISSGELASRSLTPKTHATLMIVGIIITFIIGRNVVEQVNVCVHASINDSSPKNKEKTAAGKQKRIHKHNLV
jgi:hypothetical protein